MSGDVMDSWEQKAYDFAKRKHGDTLGDCGGNYFETHILQVVAIVKQITRNATMITVAYLHDTIEDTDTTYDEICVEFNEVVADWVMELTHDGINDEYGYYFPRLQTKECIVIKFADRLSNLSRMECWDSKRQRQYLTKSRFWKDGSDMFA